jgi:phage-related protein (TIGR01555 family)
VAQTSIYKALSNLSREQLLRSLAGIQIDAWANEVTGFGTARDKTSYSHFTGFNPLSDIDLSNLYHGDAMASRMVDVVPEEMLREGFTVDVGDANANAWLEEKLDSINACSSLQEGLRWGRNYGGGIVIMGADDGRPASAELIPERVKALNYLYVVDRRFLTPFSYYTRAGHPKLGKPETYMVTPSNAYGTDSMLQVVHESRMMIFRGAPTGAHEQTQLGSWDYSVLQRPHDVLLQFNTGWKSVEVMLTDGNQAVFKSSGLGDALAADQGQQYLKKRMELIDISRSVLRAIVLDAGTKEEPGEEFERQVSSFESIPQTLDKLMLRLAAAVQIPVTILMGQSPSGMNATGDSDFRWFYNRIKSEQKNNLAPRIRKLVKLLLRTKESPLKDAKKIEVKFPDLWTLDPLQDGQRQQAIATADAAYVTAGVYTAEEVALARSAPDGLYKPIEITEESRKSREAIVKADLSPTTKEGESKASITPSDQAKVVTVNEARAAQGLGPLLAEDGSESPNGKLTVFAFAALSEGPKPDPFNADPTKKPDEEAPPAPTDTGAT